MSRRRLDSTYFDTRKLKLHRHGVTLRIRKAGANRLQTIKGQPDAAAALGRAEREEDIGSNRPRLDRAKGSALAPLLTSKLEKRLRPVFATKVSRAVLNVHVNDSDIEMAFDRGRLVSGRRAEPIHEIELELKHGRSQDVVALARRLGKALPLAFGALSKADRGYALRTRGERRPVRATPISLEPDQSVGEAFARIGMSCLRQLAANQRAVLAGDPEGIHQMRVGIRRLRAAMSLFKDIVGGRDAEAIKRELKWLADRLGPARDLDVLTTEAIAPLRQSDPDKPELATLEQDVKKERRARIEDAMDTVASGRFREIVLATALWLIDGEWSRTDAGAIADRRTTPIGAVAADILARRSRKIVKKTKRLRELDDRGRHKLRIAVKKLRYGCEFFASLFGHRKRRRRYARALKELQGCLGKLNDMRVHGEQAHRIANPRRLGSRQSQRAYAMGLLTGREEGDRGRVEAQAVKAGQELVTMRAF